MAVMPTYVIRRLRSYVARLRFTSTFCGFGGFRRNPLLANRCCTPIPSRRGRSRPPGRRGPESAAAGGPAGLGGPGFHAHLPRTAQKRGQDLSKLDKEGRSPPPPPPRPQPERPTSQSNRTGARGAGFPERRGGKRGTPAFRPRTRGRKSCGSPFCLPGATPRGPPARPRAAKYPVGPFGARGCTPGTPADLPCGPRVPGRVNLAGRIPLQRQRLPFHAREFLCNPLALSTIGLSCRVQLAVLASDSDATPSIMTFATMILTFSTFSPISRSICLSAGPI